MDTVVRARVDEATEVLREMGLTISDLLRIVVIKTAKTRQIPFELGLSPVNQAVIREIEEGRATKASHIVDIELPTGNPVGKRKDLKIWRIAMKSFPVLVCLMILSGSAVLQAETGSDEIPAASETLGQKGDYCQTFVLTDKNTNEPMADVILDMDSSFIYGVEINGQFITRPVPNNGVVKICTEEPASVDFLCCIQTRPVIPKKM